MYHKNKVIIGNVAIRLGTILIDLGISVQQNKIHTNISKRFANNLTNKNEIKEGEHL